MALFLFSSLLLVTQPNIMRYERIIVMICLFNDLTIIILFKDPKQSFRGVLLKRYSENMQQIYRRTPMPKCDFNKVAKKLYWNPTSALMFSCTFAAYFQNTFSQEHHWMAASERGKHRFLYARHDVFKRI